MGSPMGSAAPSQPRLLAIIELQNAIAAAALNADEVMHIVAERAATLTSAGSAFTVTIAPGSVFPKIRKRFPIC